MPPHYALTGNEALKTDTKKAKVKKHIECGNDLKESETTAGKFVCLHCLKSGWPVKAKP